MAVRLLRPWRSPSTPDLSSCRSHGKMLVVLQRLSEHCYQTAKLLRRRSLICCRNVVRPPQDDYDFRAETSAETGEMVRSLHPELMDLVEDGTLVVVKRSPQYVERRSDGYVEPAVVYIVGTAHMSRLSADQVTRVINAVHPENVVIELCRSRAGIMYGDEPDVQPGSSSNKSNLMSMSGDSFGSAVSRSLKLGGRSALALRLLLAGVSKRLATSAGVGTGEEFRAARKAAEDIGAQIVLGDRPIEITVNLVRPNLHDSDPVSGESSLAAPRLSQELKLQRAWRSLRWDERFRFAATLLQGMSDKNLDVSEESLQALKSDDALSAMFGELSSRFPSLLQPLIHERDMYLAWSLKRSKAVNGCQRVVGVVGRGHLRGVVHALRHDQHNLRFKDLVGARGDITLNGQLPKLRKLAKNFAIETAIGLLLWWVWDSIQHR